MAYTNISKGHIDKNKYLFHLRNTFYLRFFIEISVLFRNKKKIVIFTSLFEKFDCLTHQILRKYQQTYIIFFLETSNINFLSVKKNQFPLNKKTCTFSHPRLMPEETTFTEQPQIHVRIQQIYGRKKVTTITGIEEYGKWLEIDAEKETEKDSEKEKELEKEEVEKETDIPEKKTKKAQPKFQSLDSLLSQLKRRFNCGGHIVKKEGVITLQGEHSYDIKEVLTKFLGKDVKIVIHGKK